MTMLEVLQDESQIASARARLVQKNASVLDSKFRAMLKRFGLVRGVSMGDFVKSWDVLNTLEFLEAHVDKTAPVADIGCYASEVLVALLHLGYTDLTGIDLNPKLSEMPYQGRIRYEISDFKKTRLPDASLQAITSISVIEHGFEAEPLLKEVSRLLRPGGYFIASFDYWPEKIDTGSTKFFGMDWIIFSKGDVDALVDVAATHGLKPVGAMKYAGKDKPVHCAGKDYTFGLLVLQKAA
jgi:SAM-dependent methyltransferase